VSQTGDRESKGPTTSASRCPILLPRLAILVAPTRADVPLITGMPRGYGRRMALDRMPLYSRIEYGTNAVKRLGSRIGGREQLDRAQQELYEAFIRDARQRVLAGRAFVTTALPEYRKLLPRIDEHVEVSGRWKTLDTLADKLERTPGERLPSIHDVAGLRIVADVSTLEQRILAHAMADDFTKTIRMSRPTDILDRLENPSYGYRAVHLIVWPEGRPMEIQVRTQVQHAWAQVMETLGDRWGRELRYGLPLRHADPTVQAVRQDRVRLMLQVSDAISAIEDRTAVQGVLHLDLAPDALAEAGVDAEQLRLLRVRGERSVEEHAAAETSIRALIASLRANPTAESSADSA